MTVQDEPGDKKPPAWTAISLSRERTKEMRFKKERKKKKAEEAAGE